MRDLTGQKFNRLLVLEKTSEREYGSIVWKCQCDCGKTINVSSRSLTQNNTKSCGCLNDDKRRERFIKYNKENRPDLIGKTFGYLKVLEQTDKTSNKGTNLYYKCKCLRCGSITYVTGNNLQQEDVVSCGCLVSKGEEKIKQLLNENNIIFETQKKFNDCFFPDTNALARFDFYINHSYIIEFDGEQHYHSSKNSSWFTEENFKKIKERDNIKNQYCKKNNIPIIRIPYWRLKDLCLEDIKLETSKYII